jgi:tRNA-uridine 2-sulfurtransferase
MKKIVKSKRKTVLIGLSGGVDSAIAAYLLKEKGYNIVGAFMKNFSENKNQLTEQCHWKEERNMAIKIAFILDIPFVILDFEKEYAEKIVKPMIKSYEEGKTPNPDILCNAIIKFPLMWKAAKKLKCDYIATGHYARIERKKNNFSLLKGKDKEKDQSYFLAELSQKDLSHIIFPLGNLKKDKIREMAKKLNFPNWNKKSTAGVCFIGNIDFQSFIRKKLSNKLGDVKDPWGNIIGKHKSGNYATIGQKITPSYGFEIEKPKEFSQKRWYVAKKLKDGTIIAAPENHFILKKQKIKIKKLHLINSNGKIIGKTQAKIRYGGKLYSGELIKKSFFIFDKPVEGLAEGQYLVFYDKEKVLGCGEIKEIKQ